MGAGVACLRSAPVCHFSHLHLLPGHVSSRELTAGARTGQHAASVRSTARCGVRQLRLPVRSHGGAAHHGAGCPRGGGGLRRTPNRLPRQVHADNRSCRTPHGRKRHHSVSGWACPGALADVLGSGPWGGRRAGEKPTMAYPMSYVFCPFALSVLRLFCPGAPGGSEFRFGVCREAAGDLRSGGGSLHIRFQSRRGRGRGASGRAACIREEPPALVCRRGAPPGVQSLLAGIVADPTP